MTYQVNIIYTPTDTVVHSQEVGAATAYDARRAVAFAQTIDGRLEKGYEISARAVTCCRTCKGTGAVPGKSGAVEHCYRCKGSGHSN